MLRILIVKTSSMGDVIHNLPVISDIHARFPDAVIDWVVEEGFQDIPALHPAVRQVFPVAIRRWRKHLLQQETWREIRNFRHRLAADAYDVVLDTQGLLKSALIGLNAHGIRHGHDSQSAREPLAARFYQQCHAVSKSQHAVVRNRELAAKALGYETPKDAPDYGIAAAVKQMNATLPPQPYVMALHATSRDSKLWPVPSWIELGNVLAGQGFGMLLPWGSQPEKARAEAIASAVPQAQVLDRLPLAQLAPIMAHAKAAIGVDTGLAHLVAALDLPTIALYTDTDPAYTGLYGGNAAPILNLGGKAQIPGVQEVVAAFAQICAPYIA